MKTPKQITELNFNDIAFFNECSTSEAKWSMADFFYSPDKLLDDGLTKSGTPKIKVTDLLPKSQFETQIRSNSNLEGENKIDYIIKTYNIGVPLNKLREWSENKVFIKALRFTGKYSIINTILNTDQILRVHKSWLLANTYDISYWSKNTVLFINSNKWANDYLLEKGFKDSFISRKMNETES